MSVVSNRSNHPFPVIAIVALITMLGPFTIDTYLPSFPAIESALNSDRAMMMQTLSVYLMSFALATLIWGPLSDRWGRRPVILWSLIGYLLASLLCAKAGSYEVLILGRVLQGLFAAGSLIASRAMIRDFFPAEEAQKAMALIMMLFALAPAIAPIFGGWLEVHFGWRSVFVFLALYGVLVLSLFYFRLSETQAIEHRQSILPRQVIASYWQSICHPVFMRYVLAQGFLIGGFFLYIAGSTSLIFNHLQLQEQDFWVFFVPMVSGIIFGSAVIHFFSSRVSPKNLVNVAMASALAGVLLNLSFEKWLEIQIWSVVLPPVIYAIGFAMANPGLTIMGLDCMPEKRGLASSVQGFFQMGSAGLVVAILLPFVHHSLFAMALAQAGLFVLALLLWVSLLFKRG